LRLGPGFGVCDAGLREDLETVPTKMPVERKSGPDTQAAHDLEDEKIDQAGHSTIMGSLYPTEVPYQPR
jgi:hypothetical protein